jgi:GAF domain-containing protein
MRQRGDNTDLPDTQSSHCALIQQTAEQVRKMRDAGAPRCEILTRLVTAAEIVAGSGAVASILVLDEKQLLRNGASPNLPANYLDAIDRLKPDARIGTCAAAAATGSVVITQNLQTEDEWIERHLPTALGFVSAWSHPIKSSRGTVLGTFSTYFRERRAPTLEERNCIEALAAEAALVLDICR